MFIATLISILVSSTTSWLLPSTALLEAFTLKFHKEGISIFVPESNLNRGYILQITKHFRWGLISSKVVVSNRSLNIFSKLGISVVAIHEEKIDFSASEFRRRSNILYVTTASPYNTQTSNNTIKFLQNNFNTRGNSDREVWLLGLDISLDTEANERYWMNIIAFDNNLISYFRLVRPFISMDLDLDDDVYIYQVDTEESVKIYKLYEVYKINKIGAPILSKIGSSATNSNCCNLINVDKNIRRNDLRVSYHALPSNCHTNKEVQI